MQYGFWKFVIVLFMVMGQPAHAEAMAVESGVDFSVVMLIVTGVLALLLGRKARKFN